MKTTRSGWADTAGMRCLNQVSRCRLTLARWRSVATSDFFYAIAELAKELANRVRVRAHAGRVMQGGSQFGHRDVAVLRDDLGEEPAMRIELSFALGAALRGRTRLARPPDRERPSGTRGWRQLQTQRRRTPA